MTKKPTKLPEKGAPDAESIYKLVGMALSFWEATDDVMMGLFRWLCGDNEPIAVASYIKAPRKVRTSMLELALKTYGHRLTSDEVGRVGKVLTRLDKISPLRNEIAHGHVSQLNMTEVDGKGGGLVVADGNYLLPSFNEGNWHERSFRFHHTAISIAEFLEEVRSLRWELHEVQVQASIREQDENMAAGPEFYMQQSIASRIATRSIDPTKWSSYIRPMAEWPRSKERTPESPQTTE